MHMLDGVPLLGVSPMRLSWSSRVVKRTIDVLISSVGLVLLAPMVALIAILIKLDSRGPVLVIGTSGLAATGGPSACSSSGP